ncbi:hypothetical protein DL93DRAFT_1180200 [Clavulina sp. PMI_390]|nr:hypothetical protein DL93DRAFT_1180200 [Clavulina sp. PMI_390]
MLSEPQSSTINMGKEYQEFVIEMLQEALDDARDDLGEYRPRAMRLLQDLVSQSEQLPHCVKHLHVRNRVFRDAGGEAVIWSVELNGESVIARDARPPENLNWASPDGKLILSAVRREIVSQIQIHHPNVLPILGISSDEVHPLSIIAPLAPNGNAFRYLTMLDQSNRGLAMLEIVCS